MLQGLWQSERGFTLMELVIVIIIMGIVFAIASSTWFRAVESRKVDSAANQVAADLRQTHSKATNRLSDWQAIFNTGSQTYQLQQVCTPACSPETITLPDGTQIGTSITVTFKADGSAVVPLGSGNTIAVSSDDGCPHDDVQFTPATSEIKVVPQDC